MTKTELKQKSDAAVNETKATLQVVYDALNHGQQQKILKNKAVAALFDRYGVESEE